MADRKKITKKETNRLTFAGGSYSLLLSAVVLAVLVAVNVFVNALPATWTQLDISSSKLYSVTSNTKAVLNNLDTDITIYWIVQADEEDSIIENLLNKYDSLSSHVSVVKRNPDVYPTFAAQYTDDTVYNNSLVVTDGNRSRYISYTDIYQIEYSSYGSYGYSYEEIFDGEGCITSAIDYVVSEELPVMYILEGHGESDLPGTFADSVEKANIETKSLSLLTVDEIPDDADMLLVYEPHSDISEEEYEMLADYVSEGGRLMVISGPLDGVSLDNLNALIADYGVSVEDGIVIESDRSSYVFYPYLLLPNLESSDITDELIDSRYYIVMAINSGLTIDESTGVRGGEVTTLLTTSDGSFSKLAGYDLDTYDMEEGDIEGPFALAVSIASDGGGTLIWYSSLGFLDDSYNSYSSGANVTMAMNSVSSMLGEREALAIAGKSMNYSYLSISDATASTLEMVMIGVLPLAYLGAGVYVVLSRRYRRDEES